MKYVDCISCGKPSPSTAKYCATCGNQFGDRQPTKQPSGVKSMARKVDAPQKHARLPGKKWSIAAVGGAVTFVAGYRVLFNQDPDDRNRVPVRAVVMSEDEVRRNREEQDQIYQRREDKRRRSIRRHERVERLTDTQALTGTIFGGCGMSVHGYKRSASAS